MKMRNVIAAIVLSLSLIVCCTPVMIFAQGEEPHLVPETLWEGCEYYGSAEFDVGTNEVKVLNATSSNPEVVEVLLSENFSETGEFFVIPGKQGTSNITVTYSMNGETKETTAQYTVKPFPAFAKSLTVDNMSVDLNKYKNYYTWNGYSGTAPSIKYELGDGWDIEFISYFTDKTESEEIGTSSFEDGVTVNYPEDCSFMAIFFYFYNESGERIMHSIQLERDGGGYSDEDDLYDEGYLSNLGTPVSASFVSGSGNDGLMGVTGTTGIENIYEPGNKFIVNYDGGKYETVEYICVRQKEAENGYNIGFYPFGSVVYDMSQLYPKQEDIIIEGSDTLKKGENNVKLRISFAHSDEEAEEEPVVYADAVVTGYGDVIDGHVHDAGFTEYKTEATCITPGTCTVIWTCRDCGEELHRFTGTYYADHELTETAGKPATCTEPGIAPYWTCIVCHKHFSDEWGNYEMPDGAVIEIPASHDLKKVDAREATTAAAGNIAYWECRRCGKCFSDEEGSKEITRESTIIPKKEAPAAPANTAVQETPVVAAGEVQSVAGNTVKVTSVTANTVSFTKAKKSAKAVTVPATVTLSDGETYKVTQVEANAFKGSNATSVTLSKNITTLKAKAFNGSKVKTVTVKTSKLTKKSVKNSLKGSKVTTVKVKVGSKSANKKTVTAYKKIFTKKNAGKKVNVK